MRAVGNGVYFVNRPLSSELSEDERNDLENGKHILSVENNDSASTDDAAV